MGPRAAIDSTHMPVTRAFGLSATLSGKVRRLHLSSSGADVAAGGDRSTMRMFAMLALPVALASVTLGCAAADTDAEEESAFSESALGGCAAAQGGDHYEFLDDVCKKKITPSNGDRASTCPVAASATGNYVPSSSGIQVDGDALSGIVPSTLKMTVILVRRVGGVPHYRYLSNGSHDAPIQPLSATKFMAVANAATRLRAVSGGKLGLDTTVDGVPVGDLVTVVANYREDTFSSNGLARWFHDVGGRRRANAAIHDWLDRPARESFGGNYGAPSAALGFTFQGPSGSVSVEPDLGGSVENKLSTLTMAEFTKRLALHREDAATRLPGIQWKDLEVLFYGATRSKLFPGLAHGGMSADTAIYVQQAINMGALETRSRGRWRIFSKLGFGPSGFVHNSYTCAPSLDAAGAPVLDAGVEFVISMQSPRAGGDRGQDAQIAKVYRDVVDRIVKHTLK